MFNISLPNLTLIFLRSYINLITSKKSLIRIFVYILMIPNRSGYIPVLQGISRRSMIKFTVLFILKTYRSGTYDFKFW